MHRRELLAGLGRSAAALALGALFAPSLGRDRTAERLPGSSDDPFTLGVASGQPGPSSVVLWTRLAPRPMDPDGGLPQAPIALRWELAEDERFSLGRRHGEVLARPEHAHSAHVLVEGLPPDRRFFYRFHAGAASSPLGRTRTAPAPDAPVARLRLALASCQHYEQGAFALQREIAERELDLVLFVGDYIYESSNPRYRLRAHEGPAPTDLAGYRRRHATYKLDAALRAAHAAHPWLMTWDDHEVENDYANDASRDPRRSAAELLALRAAAYKAYFEHMPVAPTMAPVGPAMPIHAHHRWGQLADLWTLDNRQYRSPPPCPEPGRAGGRGLIHCPTLGDPNRSMFGSAQERWIGSELAASEARWRLLAQATQIAPAGIDTPLGRSLYSDGWDGYPAARARLLGAIAEQPQGNVVCLGGDVHRHVAARLRADPLDPRSAVVASEFVTSSLTSRGLSEALTELMLGSNPDLLHARSDERGYALLEVTAERVSCTLRATPFPVRPDSHIGTQAVWVVESGTPGPQRDA
ncbi:MAG TPA: alkaline phosphatase D family protein [Methylibium sp.]|nr:alkaline phosphatase D family protein [Methylibium sp.]